VNIIGLGEFPVVEIPNTGPAVQLLCHVSLLSDMLFLLQNIQLANELTPTEVDQSSLTIANSNVQTVQAEFIVPEVLQNKNCNDTRGQTDVLDTSSTVHNAANLTEVPPSEDLPDPPQGSTSIEEYIVVPSVVQSENRSDKAGGNGVLNVTAATHSSTTLTEVPPSLSEDSPFQPPVSTSIEEDIVVPGAVQNENHSDEAGGNGVLNVHSATSPTEFPASGNPLAQQPVIISVQEKSTPGSRKGEWSFYDLCPFPKRARTAAKRHATSPSLHLTSSAHMDYVKESLAKRQRKAVPNCKAKQTRSTKASASVKRQAKTAQETTQKGQKGKKAQDSQLPPTKCSGCGVIEKSEDDVKLALSWIKCCKRNCNRWYHEPCGEKNGLFDDDYFFCKGCSD